AAKDAAAAENEAAKSAERAEREAATKQQEATQQQEAIEQAARAEQAAARAEADAAVAAHEAEHEAAIVPIMPVEPAEDPDVDRRAERRAAKAAKKAEKAQQQQEVDRVVPPPPSLEQPERTSGQRLNVVLFVLGAVGLLFSVILAVGALLAAVEASKTGPLGLVSSVCDILVGPLDGLFTFSGPTAEARGDLVARGIASMGYLVIGLGLPSLARGRED
ncbi:MAG: hypothetical protein WCB95_12280, partial [Aeromicrobium sp.]